jgi:hypothetical protein
MHDEEQELVRNIKEKVKKLWECLNHDPLRRRHPVATYHLEQIASHLHSILFYLKPQQEALDKDEFGQASLCSLLDQLEDPKDLSRDSAWELAGEFERQLIDLGDDTYLYTLLKDQIGSEDKPESGPKRVPTIANWRDYFPSPDLTRLCEDYKKNGGEFSDDRTRSEVRDALRHLHLARFEEYRRDRTKLRLRARYLFRMAPLLIAFLIILCVSFLLTGLANTYFLFFGPLPSGIDPALSFGPLSIVESGLDPALPLSEQPMPFVVYLLLFVFSAGALGAIFGRVLTLGRQFARGGTEQAARGRTVDTDVEASFGIRWLLEMGHRKGLFAQVAVGGTSAVVIFLALQLFAPAFPTVAYGVIGFLTGYSEPFFTRALQETTEWGQRIGGL